jgi:hypothetical protein
MTAGLSPHFHRKFGVRISQERRLATRSTPQYPPVCLSSRETLLVFFLQGDLRGCQGRPEGAFILTLDSPQVTSQSSSERSETQFS